MDFKQLIESGAFIDNTDVIDIADGSGYYGNVLYANLSFGKSTLISMMKYFFDERENNSELFKGLNINKDNRKHRKYQIICLSFDNFKAETYKKAIQKIGDIVRNCYLGFIDEILVDPKRCGSIDEIEKYLNIIGKNYDNLEGSINDLLYIMRDYKNYKDGKFPAVFLDEPLIPLSEAVKYGYKKEMENFLRRFYSFTEKEILDCFLAVSSINPKQMGFNFYSCFSHSVTSYKTDKFFLSKIQLLNFVSSHGGSKYSVAEMERMFKEEQNKFYSAMLDDDIIGYHYPYIQRELPPYSDDKPVYTYEFAHKLIGLKFDSVPQKENVFGGDLKRLISANRKKLGEEKEKARIEKEKYRLEQKRRYAQPFPKIPNLPTKYAGVRKLNKIEKNEQYFYLLEKIQKLFDTCTDKTKLSIYKSMQGYDDIPTDWNISADFLQKEIETKHARNDVRVLHNSGSVWTQVTVGDSNNEVDLVLQIKVYVSVEGTAVKDIFLGALDALIKNGKHTFSSKVSNRKRKDSMCFWVSRHDFFVLEEYLKKHESKLVKSLDFVPYRGKIGITREFVGGFSESYNGELATILCQYFSIVKNRDEIDIFKMYQMFVDLWNDDETVRLSESDNPFYNTDAQVLITMLESLDVMLGRTELDNDNFLLSDDKFWCDLARQPCWSDVEKHMSGYKKTKYMV